MLALISFINRSVEFGGFADDDEYDEEIGVFMEKAGPGFTLPANICDLDPAITALYLGACNLSGMNFCAQYQCRKLALGELFAVDLVSFIYHAYIYC